MADEYTEGISFKQMEESALASGNPLPQGAAYAGAGIRNYDETYLPKCQAEHERAREQGSKG